MSDSLSSSAADTWPLRRVGLRVQDIGNSIEYYSQLGLQVTRDERGSAGTGSVGLGVGTHEVLQLRSLPGGKPRPRHSAGLYHFALLLPDETELGRFLQHCLDQHIRLDGASDHLVSQALYLSDPEGNGIEVYADRPREQWRYEGGSIAMATLPLGANELLRKAQGQPGFAGFPEGLRLGHMHLNVGNLHESMPFYQRLGMDLMVGIPDQANFLSWDGYHHHLGINLWRGRGAQPMTPDVYGLDFYEIRRPELAPATLHDADGVTVTIL